jgi:anaerobic glycerol-3-phosphate dehydrogenase
MREVLVGAGCEEQTGWITDAHPLERGARLVLENRETLEADAVVIATGKFFAAGARFSTVGFRNGIAGLAAYLDGRPLALGSSAYGPEPERAFSDASGFRVGLGHDHLLRVLDTNGRPMGRIFAAGAALEAFDVAVDATLGLCAVTGHLAGTYAARIGC